MNLNMVQGILDEVIGNIKQKWGHFTDNNILKMKGFYQAYYGTLRKKNGLIKDKDQKQMKQPLEGKRRGLLLDKNIKRQSKTPSLRIVFHKQEWCVLQK
jgi:uncharacterized protein YjbJ (UPF0337 family)